MILPLAAVALLHPGTLGIGMARADTLRVEYSTYLGGQANEEGRSVALGRNDEACIVGMTGSDDFPTYNPYQAHPGNYQEAFVARLGRSGSHLIFSTYLGGSSWDEGWGIDISGEDNVVVTGDTTSGNFPTHGTAPTQSGCCSEGPFVTSFSSSGSGLIFSLYFSRRLFVTSYGIDVSRDGKIYIAGIVAAQDFPTENAYQGDQSGLDAFVTCLSSSGSAFVFSTFLGGSDVDWANRVVVNDTGDAYVVGVTNSPDFPTENPYQASNSRDHMDDAFVTCLASSGSRVIYSTYLGGASGDIAYGACLGSDNKIFLTGDTLSSDFPLRDPYQIALTGGDAFVSCLDASGSELLFSTLLGGSGREDGHGIAVASTGEVFVAGLTESLDFPTLNSCQSACRGASDSFVSCLSSSGSALLVSTYWGGSSWDLAAGICLGEEGALYITGFTQSRDFPTDNPYQATLGGLFDAFLSKFVFAATPGFRGDSGDYDGDDLADIALFRPAAGLWAMRNSTKTYFGMNGDVPVSGDYDGDGTSDLAVFRAAEGFWSVRDITLFFLGLSSDIPVPRDYDQDEKTEGAVFRGSTGLWRVLGLTQVYFGGRGDLPIPDDYDGDGGMDVAIFRPSNGLWAIRGLTRKWLGTAGDLPVPADYDLDGTTEIAIYRRSNGLWSGVLSPGGESRVYFGIEGDDLAPANYNGGDWIQPAVFRPSSGLWAVRNLTRCWFGSSGDIPVTR